MKRFGLVGRTLKHSFSKTYFEAKFAREGIEGCSYENFELQDINELPGLIGQDPSLAGLNITIPYKELVLPLLREKTEEVLAIGACNCIRVGKDGLIGFNTDAAAFELSLRPRLQAHHLAALVLGSGGASRSVCHVLGKLGIRYQVVSRNKKPGTMTYEEIGAELLDECLLIVNTTPLGMFPHVDDAPLLPYHAIGPRHFLFDLVYNPQQTKFLAKGQERGALTANGYEMLVLQAEASWKIWNGLGA